MRYLLLVLITAAITAQSPLTTTFLVSPGGAVGNATYHELEALDPAGVSIFQIDVALIGNGGLGATLDVYLQPLSGPGTLDYQGQWFGPVVTASAPIYNPSGTPTPFLLSQPLELGPNCRFGVAFVCNQAQSYANPISFNLPLQFQTNELELLASGASNVPFAGTLFSPRIGNTSIYYTSGGSCPPIARCDPIGDGCSSDSGSFYELTPPTSFDLSGMKLVGTRTASGYDVTLVPGSGFSPSPTAMPLTLPDDGSVDTASVGGTLGLHVGSNCWIATGGGNSSAFAPVPASMLGNPSTGIYSWTDFDPTNPSSGQVYYEEVGTLAIVTYDGVFGWGTPNPNEVEFRYDAATQDFSIEWGVTSVANPENWLIGYSPGGASPDPGNTDISAAVPFSFATEVPLALDCLERPIQDPGSATAFTVATRNIKSNAQIHAGMIGFPTAPVGLGLLGLPGDCTLYLSPVAIDAQVLAPSAGTLNWSPITLPPLSAATYAGFTFRLQAATLAVGGFVEARVSNALQCVVGDQ